MTTIVFNAETQEIACDSRATGGNGLIVTDKADKCWEVDGDRWFLAGTVADMEEFVHAEVGNTLENQLECVAFVIRADGTFWTVYTNEEHRVRTLPLEYTEAIGSGGDWAVAGIDLGLTTRAAVEYAMTRDANSGGAVHVHGKDGIIEPDNSIE